MERKFFSWAICRNSVSYRGFWRKGPRRGERPERGWIFNGTFLGFGYLGGDWHLGSFPRQPLCFETLPICMERLLSRLLLSHCH